MEKKILVIARWPLGGIRTYMRYVFNYFPPSFKISIIASSTHEDDAIIKDVEKYKARLLLVHGNSTSKLTLKIFSELCRCNYDIILSQGFTSAVAAYIPNLMFKVPHILTIHGILEPKYLSGRLAKTKKTLLGKVLNGTTVLYGVSNDILDHLYEQFPELRNKGPRAVVIPNGIELSELVPPLSAPEHLRNTLLLDDSKYLFGFFGRFMPQKGFDLLIQAVNNLRQQKNVRPFAVVAVGSGDYIRECQKSIKNLGLEQFFYFLPFHAQVYQLYPQVNSIIMPSRWEASGLLAMEALCMGVPLIASDCIGLRETISDTPTLIFPSEDLSALINVMYESLHTDNTPVFSNYVSQAKKRYDVANTAKQLIKLIQA